MMNPDVSMRPTILLLREGTDDSQGKGQLISNINACQAVAEAVRTTLGPRGMDKLIHDGTKATISNDGAKILQLLDIVHPAAKTLVDIARAQDAEIGDGTTTVTLLAAEMLRLAKTFVEDGVHPQIIVRGYRKACLLALEKLSALAITMDETPESRRSLLEKCASTSLNSKLIARYQDFFAPMVVDAVTAICDTGASSGFAASSSSAATSAASATASTASAEGGAAGSTGGAAGGAGSPASSAASVPSYSPASKTLLVPPTGAALDLSLIGIKKVPGGSVTESFLVNGVAFKRTFSYAGFEQQPKRFAAPRILLLNVELELKNEKENAEVRIDDVSAYQSIVDAEWSIIYDKLQACVDSGAQIILSKLPIGDLATQYFADRGLFCAGRVSKDDLERVARSTGARIQTTVSGLTPDVLGSCESFEERQIGAERYNLFMGCSALKTATMVLRGGSEQFIDETERSVHDALMIVKAAIKAGTRIVAGGGAIEMEVSKHLRDYSKGIMGKQQGIIAAFARALEVIPRQLADNAGFDSTDIMNRLRQKHAAEDASGVWFGVDIDKEGITDTFASGVWEPAASKVNSFASATEAACLILSVDETVRNPKSGGDVPGGVPAGGGPLRRGAGGVGLGRGAPMSAALGGAGMRGMMGGRGIRMYQGKGGK